MRSASRSRQSAETGVGPATRIAFLLGCIALAACDDRKSEGEAPSSDVVRIEDRTPGEWMRRGDARDPAIWLASKELGQAASSKDARVDLIRQALVRARERFLESDRMIANRTAQLAEMLVTDGKPEDYATITEELSSVVNAARGKETYGEVCQYYYFLRHGGAEKAEALRMLTERYGSANRRR